MTEEKIVGIHGASVASAKGETDSAILEIVQDLVAKADGGDLLAIAVAYVRRGNITGSSWHMVAGVGHTLVACVSYLQHDLCFASYQATKDTETK